MNFAARLGAMAFAFHLSLGHAAAWTPPAKVDVDQILREAGEDARAGRFDDAAAKHRWYHANALSHAPSHVGVRVSFALMDWYQLARKHPAAMQDMLTAQDQAAQAVRNGGAETDGAMRDLTALAETLGDPKVVVSTFAWLDANRPADARRFVDDALPSLLTAQQVALAVRYLDVDAMLKRSRGIYETLTNAKRSGESEAERRLSAQNFVDRQAAFAVAALAKAGRAAEAAAMRERLRALLGTTAPMRSTEDALRGHAPPLQRY